MKRIGEYNEEDSINWLKRQTPVGLFLKAVGVVLGLVTFFGAIGFAAGWFKTTTDVVSPENVTEQWRFAYEFDESLDATARQWCSAKQVEVNETNDEVRSQRVTQRVAIEQNYARIAADYDARLRNAFEAKLVAPPDVPDEAPALTDKTGAFCPNLAD
ncbi:MAG: hypothetical protein KDA17_07200 [Candidatus Saccharibacteria bacterium]|nr:hypothetical protein [Candidatus Saccharibacteria bacterium]